MNRGEPVTQHIVAAQEFDRCVSVLANTGFIFGDLLRDMHMKRKVPAISPCSNPFQIVQGHRANTVWRDTEVNIRRGLWILVDERFHVAYEIACRLKEA